MLYYIFRSIFSIIFRLNRFRVIGREFIPKTGPVILACNHISNWDPEILGSATPRKVVFIAKIELFKAPVVGFLMKAWGAIPVQRGRSDREAITRSLETLNAGNVLGIFIEGRRNKGNPDQMLPPQLGAAMLALKSGVPVVPAAINNSREVLRSFKRVEIRFGPPLQFNETAGEDKKELYQRVSNEITAKIKELF